MKNDLDFIRDKIENSGVQAPGEMGENFVRETLDGVQPQPVIVPQPSPQPKKKKGWKVALSVTAAVLAIAVGTGVALSVFRGRLPEIGSLVTGGVTKTEELPGGLALKHFGNRLDIISAVIKLQTEHEKQDFADYLNFGGSLKALTNGKDTMEYAAGADSYSESEKGISSLISSYAGVTGGSSMGHNSTYIQVTGVNEADVIETDGRYIYCADSCQGSKIVIFSAEGKQSRRVAELDVRENREATPDEAAPTDGKDFDDEAYLSYYNIYIENMYLCGDRLVVLINDYREEQTMTTAQVYDVSDIGSIKLVGTNTQSGSCRSSRMIGDTLYTVSSYTPYREKYIPLCYDGKTPREVPCDCVYALDDPDSESFLVVSAYDVASNESQAVESKAILGTVDDIYCNLDHMYIYAARWNYGEAPWYNVNKEYVTGEEDDDSEPAVTTQILKVDLKDGIRFTAYTEVDGTVDDQYALDERDGCLRVAATVFGGSERDYNCLYVLDENLGKIGEVTGFAQNESIKAVRYIGDTAYVITYEQTDPLFVIDLSEPTAPKILGEVKISGFSTMLVPIEGDMLLGIGYHTQNEDYTDMEVQEGLKLALFDVSDKANPKVLDSISYVDCYSEVQYNPKALVVNRERGDFVIPLNYAHYDSSWEMTDGYGYYASTETHGGMLNFTVENGKLREISRYDADYQEDVERCVYVGDTVYMTHHDANDNLLLDSVKYQ